MKKSVLNTLFLVACVVWAGIGTSANARSNQGNELAYFGIPGLETLAGGSVSGANDYIPVYDASAGKVKKVIASTFGGGGAFNGTVGATTPNTGAFTTLSASSTTLLQGTITIDDGTTASPDVVFQDGTDETATWSKADAGNLSVTMSAAGDGLQVLTGNFFVGNGTPGETINGEDLYVEGISEFDGTANFDGSADFDGAIVVDTTTLQENGLKFAGRGYFEICGDATTVNNNTVYYGPSQAVVDSATVGQVTCNTDEAGNTTEATADAPSVTGMAWVPLGMVCYSTDQGATVTYTLRAGAAAYDAGALVVSIADNILSGATPANTIGQSAIAADTAVAVAVASSADMAATSFICRIQYAY